MAQTPHATQLPYSCLLCLFLRLYQLASQVPLLCAVGFPCVLQRVHPHILVHGHALWLVLHKSKNKFLGHVSFALTIPYHSYDLITI